MTDEQRREAIQAYWASTTFMDAQVGHVLDALDRLGLSGQHGRRVHERSWLPPGRSRPVAEDEPVRAERARAADHRGARARTREGVAARGLAELVDLYPTLAELAGLQPQAARSTASAWLRCSTIPPRR